MKAFLVLNQKKLKPPKSPFLHLLIYYFFFFVEILEVKASLRAYEPLFGRPSLGVFKKIAAANVRYRRALGFLLLEREALHQLQRSLGEH